MQKFSIDQSHTQACRQYLNTIILYVKSIRFLVQNPGLDIQIEELYTDVVQNRNRGKQLN